MMTILRHSLKKFQFMFEMFLKVTVRVRRVGGASSDNAKTKSMNMNKLKEWRIHQIFSVETKQARQNKGCQC